MQNKGFVKFFAIMLALICVYYLSFSFATRYQMNKAEKLATDANNVVNTEVYNQYLDSIATEKIWLGNTYKECQEREIALGLDLKGGMNVILEISIPDVLKALSNNNTDANFNKAIEMAKVRQQEQNTQKDFLTLFEEAYKELDPNAQLAAIFSTYELKERIPTSASNNEVMNVLRDEVNSAMDNSFNVLRQRIDRFGVVQPNIQRLDMGRILVELPGIKEQERVRKLLQGTANLEFFETFEFSEIASSLTAANNIIRNLQNTDSEEVTVDSTATAEVVKDSISEDIKNDLLSDLNAQSATAKDSLANADEERAKWEKENPLFSLLIPSQYGAGPVMGYALARDTSKINAMLAMKQVKEILPRNLSPKWSVKAFDEKGLYFELIAIKITNRDGKAPLDGSVITDAKSDNSQYSASNYEVSMTMDVEGSKTWARMTKENIGRSIAIVLDGYVYSFPRVNGEITGGRSSITGNFTPEEAKDLANVLKSGTMPAPMHIVQEDIVGPSLGQEAINSGLISFIIAFCIVLLYMIFYYGLVPGLVADFALITNLFFLVGILVAWRATLTLPGIAGIVLTMGMAVDSNVLIYERIRENLRAGLNVRKAVSEGFSSALSAILDSNITTLLTGIILAYFGTGPIRGFATTLIIGILTSVFTAVFVTRLILGWLSEKGKLDNTFFISNITKNWFQNVHFDFIGARKKFYILSGILMVVIIVSLCTRGMSLGIDFSGGRNYIVRFEEKVSTEDVQKALYAGFGENMMVTTIGAENQIRISTNYKIDDNSENLSDEIESLLYESLKGFYKHDITKEMFCKGFVVDNGAAQLSVDKESSFGIQTSQKVGATIANDIKISAIWSVLFSLIVIALYILWRFRNISFSIGAICALVHDTMIILGIYSLLYSIVPFSLEVDQQFIAAVLTIIGYSINDTVVVFDRVREIIGLYPKRDRAQVTNEAINLTLNRTFNTSITTALVLLIIFFFGGEVIRGFVFALLCGVIAGTYSTLFVAVPISFDIFKKLNKNKEIEK
ncbi:MAG: protein translocase subunit SecDF [Paludibacteraceae bacterium]|nr:protein translocase subunit SecDF [Paludibacteraceae bacterium]